MRVSSEIKFEPSPRTRVGIERPPEKDVDLKKRVDPLRRLISTPYTTNLSCMGKCVRLETNDAQVFEHGVMLAHRHVVAPTDRRGKSARP